jgi:hypothetical protein
VKNCNIVQTEAEVAIISLNPSIAIRRRFFVLAEKSKLLLDEDAAAGNKTTEHILPVVLHAKYNVIQTSKKMFPYRCQHTYTKLSWY